MCSKCGHKRTVPNGKYLRWLREQSKLTLRALGKTVKLSPSYLCEIEQNKKGCPNNLLTHYQNL